MTGADDPDDQDGQKRYGKGYWLSPAEFGVFATIALIPLLFVWLALSLLGLKSQFWFLLFVIPLVLSWRLYPLYLRSRSNNPLALGDGQIATGKKKRDLLIIAAVTITAALLAQVFGSEIRSILW
jgi:cobalamin synthase